MRKKALSMSQRTLHRAATLAARLATIMVASLGVASIGVACFDVACFDVAWAGQPAVPAPPPVKVVASEFGSNFVPLGVGKSVVVDLPRDIKDVLVADPKIANAVVRTSRRAYLIGAAIGQTSVFFFDAEGRQLAGFDIAVTRDLNGMRAALRQMFPQGNVHVEGISDGVMLSGSVASPIEAQQAYDVAKGLVGDAAKVVNGIAIRGRDQVMIHVEFAEVDREVVKQFGINLTGTLATPSGSLNFNTVNPFSANGGPLSPTKFTGSFKSMTATLQAMERAGVTRILAAPTLAAISGESANFLAGGKFPYPTPPAFVGAGPGFTFENFGVSLTFTPVVLAEGRISLKVLTEVSELAPENSVTVSGTTVPGLTVRRAETVVEIPSGGSLAMAGMLREETKHHINGIPQLMQVPILGALFKSNDYINNQTELMVIVTPHIVQAVARSKLSLPDDGFADSPDPSAVLLSRLNRIYGGPGAPDARGSYRGSYGFIID
jgi:pilus assembly protein CpaC